MKCNEDSINGLPLLVVELSNEDGAVVVVVVLLFDTANVLLLRLSLFGRLFLLEVDARSMFIMYNFYLVCSYVEKL